MKRLGIGSRRSKRTPSSRISADSRTHPLPAKQILYSTVKVNGFPRGRLINLKCLSSFGRKGLNLAAAAHHRWGTTKTLLPGAGALRRWSEFCTAEKVSIVPNADEAQLSIPAFATGLKQHGGRLWGRTTKPCSRSLVINIVSNLCNVFEQYWLDLEGEDGRTLSEWLSKAHVAQTTAQSFAGTHVSPKSRMLSDEHFEKILRASREDILAILKSPTTSEAPRAMELVPFIVQLAALTAMNAESLLNLKRDCLKPPPVWGTTHSKIEWRKDRAADVILDAIYPNLVKDGFSVPDLVRHVQARTTGLSPRVFSGYTDDLWLYEISSEDWNHRRENWALPDLFTALRNLAADPIAHVRRVSKIRGRRKNPFSILSIALVNKLGWSYVRTYKLKALFNRTIRRVKRGDAPADILRWLEIEETKRTAALRKAEVYSLSPPGVLGKYLDSFAKRHRMAPFRLVQIRPTVANAFLRQGKTIYQLQVFLHHKDARTTVRYVARELLRPVFRRIISKTQQILIAATKFSRTAAQSRMMASGKAVAGVEDVEAFRNGLWDQGTSSCRNPYKSPIPGQVAGRKCTAFDSCYFCPHAVWFREHLPLEIAKLRRWESLRAVEGEPMWTLKYSGRCRVIREEIIPAFPKADRDSAEIVAAKFQGLPMLAAPGRMT